MKLNREQIRTALKTDMGEMPWVEGLGFLTIACESVNVGFEFSYDTGLYQEPGEGVDDWSEPVLDKKRKGYTMMVAGYMVSDDHGPVYWETPGEAVGAGMYLLDSYLDGEHLTNEDE